MEQWKVVYYLSELTLLGMWINKAVFIKMLINPGSYHSVNFNFRDYSMRAFFKRIVFTLVW